MAETMTEPVADAAEVLRALAVLHPDQTDVIELRAIGVRSRQWPNVTSGYFLDRQECAQFAAMLSPLAEGVYFTLNRINPALLARAVNRLRGRDDSSETTADHHVSRRLWLPVDCDPVRPKGISATEEERGWALARAYAIRSHLWSEGWSSPVVADSGNGTHLLYQVDLDVADGDYVKRTIETLARRFNDERVHIDVTVFNPARIWKLYGTLARKGDHAPSIGRPHRLARLLEVPGDG